MQRKRILVIHGGDSREREISLKSSKSCIKALKKIGYKVFKLDPKYSSLLEIKKINPDVIFNALHGKNGEDGNVQCYFEFFQKSYTHSGVLSSMIAMNKHFSKKLFIDKKIATPKYFYLNKNDCKNVDFKKNLKIKKMNFPIVIKPNDEGSSIGVRICKNLSILKKAFEKIKKKHDNLILEQYIPGQEIQVAIMGGKPLGAIELRPKRKFYDYEAKYKKSAKTEHIMPAEISKKKYKEVLNISRKANKVLGCKGIVRCDFRYYKNKFYLLELNTQPGMTDLSLVPEIARFYKISFEKLVKWMVDDASINR